MKRRIRERTTKIELMPLDRTRQPGESLPVAAEQGFPSVVNAGVVRNVDAAHDVRPIGKHKDDQASD
jgi:hypothetical protein